MVLICCCFQCLHKWSNFLSGLLFCYLWQKQQNQITGRWRIVRDVEINSWEFIALGRLSRECFVLFSSAFVVSCVLAQLLRRTHLPWKTCCWKKTQEASFGFVQSSAIFSPAEKGSRWGSKATWMGRTLVGAEAEWCPQLARGLPSVGGRFGVYTWRLFFWVSWRDSKCI